MSAVMPESMALLLEKYSPEQIAEVIDAVMKMRPSASQSAVVASPTPVSAIIERKKRAKKSTSSKTAQTSARPSNSVAPTRPLNSWMAFRSFYSPIFKTYQQKDISGFLTTMWQNDPFKAKWSILAKAYSIIRENNTKNAAPLDKFLSLTCPLIGIVPRDEYLGVMGWSIVDTAGVKNMERLFTPEISSFPESFLMTNLSAEDIVAHCYQVSYIQHNTNDIARNPGATATLTMAAQPTSNSTQPTFMSTQPAALPTQSPSSSSSPVELNFAATEPQQDQQDGHDFFVANSVHGNFDVQDVLTHNNNGAVGASGVVRQTVHDLSGQQFPFMDEFDPFSTSALDFDPFNMSQDAAFASNSVGTYLAPGSSEFPEAFNIDDLLSSELFDMTE